MVGDFCGSLISRILDFQVSREKFSRFSISDFARGNNFSRISCTVFESNKHGSHLVVLVTLFATHFIEVQQCKKASGIFVGGSLFHGILLSQINEKSAKFAIIRSHVNFIPHVYFKNSFFF